MKPQNFKKLYLFFIAIATPFFAIGETRSLLLNTNSIAGLDLNWILTIIAFILLLPLYVAGKTFLMAAKVNLNRKKTGAIKKAGMIVFFILSFGFANAQTEVATTPMPASGSLTDWLPWLLMTVILFESFLIVFFLSQASKMLNQSTEVVEEQSVEKVKVAKVRTSWLANIWQKINKFKPVGTESDIDTGHNYDGIRELDNITPPWFTTAFILSIIFAIVYMVKYHVLKTSPLQIEEYNIAMAAAEKEKANALLLQGNLVDENSVTMLGAADIENGKSLFAKKCAACHGPEGGSMPGGVGPNLTDDYWIHGGSLSDIFKSIKYGWPEKGMVPWKDNYSAKELAQITSYIKSIKGSNPAGAKEPQGELYKDAGAAAVSDSTKNDSTKLIK